MSSSRFSLLVSGALLGTGGLTGRLLGAATGLSPVAVACCRLAGGGALIVVFLLLTGRRPPAGRAAWTRIASTAVLAAGYQACYFAALAITSVSLATLVAIGAFPVLVAVAEHALRRRRIDRHAVATIALALSGLTLLVGLPQAAFRPTAVLASAGLAVLAAGGFAAVSLLAARPVPGLAALETTGYAFALGGLLLVPLSGQLRFAPTVPAIALLAGLALAPTALAYTLYFRGLRAVPAGTAAVILLLEPLTGAVLAALVLHDRLGVAGIAGGALLGVAVARAAADR